jgi:hypothetical protein
MHSTCRSVKRDGKACHHDRERFSQKVRLLMLYGRTSGRQQKPPKTRIFATTSRRKEREKERGATFSSAHQLPLTKAQSKEEEKRIENRGRGPSSCRCNSLQVFPKYIFPTTDD